LSNWSYNLILRGSPTVRLSEGLVRLEPGRAIVAVRDSIQDFRFRDEPHRYTELLVWIWREPPYELGYKHPGNFSRAFKAFRRRAARKP
jgi:hypothetical protein